LGLHAVYADGVMVRETCGNGFVAQVEVRSVSSGEFEEVCGGVDPSFAGTSVDYLSPSHNGVLGGCGADYD